MINQRIEKFTQSQEEAILKLKEFLKVPVTKDLNSRVFVLSGKAGTGKTTIIKYALEKELEQDRNNIDKNEKSFNMFTTPKVVGVTQSHKAKNVLSQSIYICKTFASTFGLEIVYNEDGSQDFVKPKFKNAMKNLVCEQPVKVFVHDEVSMYDKNMLGYVLKETNAYSKVIMMGDAGQLPPVSCEGDEDSPVFDLPISDNNKHCLLERVRQTEGNPILELSDIIYEEIFANQNMARVMEALKKEEHSDGKGIRHVKRSDFLADFKGISVDYTDTKVVAYRNATVNDFNQYIRKYIHNNPDKQFIKGEIIYMTDSFYNEVKGNKYICYNSDEYIIKEVSPSKALTVGESNEIKIERDFLAVEKKGHAHLFDVSTPGIPVVNLNSISKYNKQLSTLVYFAKKAFDKKTKGFLWKKYFDFKANFGSVSYGYCYTGHKIQGSGYKNVYVDVNDILTVSMISPKRKLQAIYTAITRATDLVILIKK